MMVGNVVAIYVYPVKGMRGQLLDRAKIGFHGLDGDRRFAFQLTDCRNGLPWVSGRQVPWLGCYVPVMDSGTPVGVTSAQGAEIELSDFSSMLSNELGGRPVKLTQLWRGTYDAMDVSVVSTRTLQLLSELAGSPVDGEQARANIVVAVVKSDKKLLGSRWLVGAGEEAPRLELPRLTQRCEVLATDRHTGAVDTTFYEKVRLEVRNKAGLYGVVVRPGLVEVGASIQEVG